MPTTFYTHQRYGAVTPTQSGQALFGPCKYGLAPVISEATTNRVYSFDATADYQTYSPTGMVGFYDAQFGMIGVGSTRYILDGSSPTPNVKIPAASHYDTGVDTYKTASLYIWSEHALQFRLDVTLQNSSSVAVGGTDSTTITLTPNKWNRIQTISTANAQKVLATLNIVGFSSSTDTGKVFYIDCVQIEDKRYSTSFINQPGRVAAQIDYTIPRIGPDYTITGWAKVGNTTTTVGNATAPFFTLYNSSTDYATVRYVEGTTKVQAFKDDTDPNTDFSTTALDLNPGDLVFFALVNDGLTMTIYTGKPGSSLLTASQATDFGVFNTIYLGRDTTPSYLNGPVENLVLHKKALSQANIEAIFALAQPITYLYSQDVIFVTGDPLLGATTQALSYASTGYYRYENQTVSLDIVSASSLGSTLQQNNGTHIVYGDDVEKLELNGLISTGTNLTTSTNYLVNSMIDIPNIGKTAFVTKQ
jgi:hypothetical protein